MPHLIPDATYVYAKEACYRCGAGGPLVDMDVNIEGEGCLALCPSCIGESAQVAGFKVSKPRAAK